MATNKTEKFSIIDLFTKGGIPNPAGYPVPKPPAHTTTKKSSIREDKTVNYHSHSKTDKK